MCLQFKVIFQDNIVPRKDKMKKKPDILKSRKSLFILRRKKYKSLIFASSLGKIFETCIPKTAP